MLSSLRVIVVCASLVTWLPAQAQFLGFGLETNVELTKQDLDIIRHTVNEQVHGKPVGTTAKSKQCGVVEFRQDSARQEIHAKRPAMRDPRLQVDN